jgi:Ca-activated chloride channel family protein
MNARRMGLLALLFAVAVCRSALAAGVMLPEDKALPPLGIQNLRVRVEIDGGVATTEMSEVFLNSTDRRLEATFVFPVPRDAALTDFAMYINGKRESGEIVEAGKAREIYEEIVRRMRDPGLLEYMNSGVLKMRVFPIEPRSSVKVEVSYTHPLSFDAGLYGYTYPLRTGSRASSVLQDFTVTVNIASKQAIKSVYSPTHEIGVSRKDDRHAVAGFEQTRARLDRDFSIFYSISDEDFGLNLLTHRIKGQDGFFAVMISPRVEIPDQKVMPKDVCFVIDVSGSMEQQDRIESAREAVKFCLKALNPGDRFALLTFSTTVEAFADELQEATPKAVEEAVAFVDGLRARGGTDLCGAVLKALSMAPGADRPYLVVLATDGEPTVGEVTEPDEIVARVKEVNKSNIRVFPFGIAEDLNVVLLDQIAEVTQAYSEYVAPGSAIEERISSFFRKVSDPVMSDLTLDFGKADARDVYPPRLPDLFRGSQVVAFGRYTGEGSTAVRLTGLVRGMKETFAYDAQFPAQNDANAFVPKLWARRKMGYLLDQIRLHGESQELVGEVTELSKEYGIATPYTSYLVLENEEAYRRHGIVRGMDKATAFRSVGAMARLRAPAAAAPAPAAAEAEAFAADWAATGARRGAGGEGAVRLSETLREWKDAEAAAAEPAATVQHVSERTFVLMGGVYVDTAYEEGMEALKIMWGTDAYFAILDALPELTDCLKLAEYLVVVVDGKALVIGDEGEQDKSADQIREFFAK